MSQTHNETITSARNFLMGKLSSLKLDCKQCLFGEHPAPFPALLFCFSVIDLLGALYAGNASDNAPTTRQSKDYMTGIMKYPDKVAELMQDIFRHKLVHLAQPNPKTTKDDKTYLWWFCHESNRTEHLKIQRIDQTNEFWFKLSIWNLVEDIEESVLGPAGYIEKLVNNEGNVVTNFNKVSKDLV